MKQELMADLSLSPSPESGTGPLPHAIREGQTYEQWWPFRRDTYGGPPDYNDTKTWAPGFNREIYGPDDVGFEFDGEGHELRTIVSIHVLPKPYKPRIFYRRQWRDPDGKLFGRGYLAMCGEQAFRHWLAGKKVEFLEESREENACVEGYNVLHFPRLDENGFRHPEQFQPAGGVKLPETVETAPVDSQSPSPATPNGLAPNPSGDPL